MYTTGKYSKIMYLHVHDDPSFGLFNVYISLFYASLLTRTEIQTDSAGYRQILCSIFQFTIFNWFQLKAFRINQIILGWSVLTYFHVLEYA